ncbi:MAG: hypothetical protein ACRCYU_17485, partial [Nocardioides sp.]
MRFSRPALGTTHNRRQHPETPQTRKRGRGGLTTVAVALGLSLTLAACGDAGSDQESGTKAKVVDDAATAFEDGTRMKELAEAGKVTIGVKFDQPGIG